jgi:type III secretion protein C
MRRRTNRLPIAAAGLRCPKHPVVISDKVEGKVNGKFIAVEPQALLESLAAAYGLIWFFDGDVLYIYDDSEIDSQIINAPGLDFDQLDRILRDLGQPRTRCE